MAVLSCRFHPISYRSRAFLFWDRGSNKWSSQGKVQGCDMEGALGMLIINDFNMVLASGSIAQSKATGVVIDFSAPTARCDNMKQATAFGMLSVVKVPRIKPETVLALSAFCEKGQHGEDRGCLVAPTLSIGSILLQQAAISAAFQYNNVEIVE